MAAGAAVNWGGGLGAEAGWPGGGRGLFGGGGRDAEVFDDRFGLGDAGLGPLLEFGE